MLVVTVRWFLMVTRMSVCIRFFCSGLLLMVSISFMRSNGAMGEHGEDKSISTPEPVFGCPVGYRKVTRRGTHFCSPFPHGQRGYGRKRCPDGQNPIRLGSRIICDAARTNSVNRDKCPPELLRVVIHGTHFRCADPRSPHVCASGQTLVPTGNNAYECRTDKNPHFTTNKRRKRPFFKNKGRKGKTPRNPKSTLFYKVMPNLKSGKDPKVQSKNGSKLPIVRQDEVRQSIPGVPECDFGQVSALSETGYVCVEPVFPTSVCPPGQVPLMLPEGLQCAPCPSGQTAVQRENGVSCVTIATTTETPCPHGLVPIETPVGRVCRYIPPPAVPLNDPRCPKGQIAKVKDGVVSCESLTCPRGTTAIRTRHGTAICAVPLPWKQRKCTKDETFVDGGCVKSYTKQPKVSNTHPVKDQHQTISDKECPPGEHSVQTQNGIICHSSVPNMSRSGQHTSQCELGTILTRTMIDFQCLPIDLPVDLIPISQVLAWRVDKMPINGGVRGVANNQIPVCRRGFVPARIGETYECITEYDAELKCKVSETLVRLEDGFMCKEAMEEARKWEEPRESTEREDTRQMVGTRERKTTGEMLDVSGTKCRPTEVTSIDEHGHPKCITLAIATEMCGDGFVAVPDDNQSFICRLEKLELQCPVGFSVSLKQGLPVCVSDRDKDCLEASTRSSRCIADMLPCLPGYALDNSGETPRCTVIYKAKSIHGTSPKEGTKTWMCKGDITEGKDGASNAVRPCDFNAELLLAGCNPDCANGGTCVNGACACPDGITGSACQQDIDECREARQRLCDHDCVNTFGSYFCTCSHDNVLGTDGRTCTAPGCIPDCLNNGSCINDMCACPRGFDGDHCQTDKDECLMHGTRLCQYTCRNTYGGYQCICPPGTRLNRDQRTCMNTTCIPGCRNRGQCENGRCVCPPGYYGIICQLDINECYKFRPCQHVCHNSRGSYTCACHHGYTLHTDGHSCI